MWETNVISACIADVSCPIPLNLNFSLYFSVSLKMEQKFYKCTHESICIDHINSRSVSGFNGIWKVEKQQINYAIISGFKSFLP